MAIPQIVVAYLDDIDRVYISSRSDTFAAKTLGVEADGDTIRIMRLPGLDPVVDGSYTYLTRADGSGFATTLDCLAYLQGVCGRAPAGVPSVTATALEDIVAGSPVALSRVNGGALNARAGTYVAAFVVGLAKDDAASGFPVRAIRSAVSRADWTSVAGTTVLTLAQPYFLAPASGLTLAPDRTPGSCLVRIGTAADPNTLVFQPSDPILL